MSEDEEENLPLPLLQDGTISKNIDTVVELGLEKGILVQRFVPAHRHTHCLMCKIQC